jgi:hypothetical protein
MKKLFLIVVCAVMAVLLAACGAQSLSGDSQPGEQEQAGGNLGGVQIPNPFTDCETIEEAEDLAGFDIALPGSLPEGYSRSAIRAVKDGMIEIIYTNGNDEIRIRKGMGSEDISGDYSEYGETGTEMVGGLKVTMKGSGGKVNAASWQSGGYAFSVTVNPGGEGLDKAIVADMVSGVK